MLSVKDETTNIKQKHILVLVSVDINEFCFHTEPSGPTEPRGEKLPHLLRSVSRNQQPAERWVRTEVHSAVTWCVQERRTF